MLAIPHLDKAIVATLREVMGQDYDLLIETYINDSNNRLQSLAEGIANHDGDCLRRTAHSFKGSSSNIGAMRLAEYCSVMESLALANDPLPWPGQLVKIEAEFAHVAQLLQPPSA